VVLAWAFQRALRDRVAEVTGAVERPARELSVLARILERLEREPPASPRVAVLRERLTSGERASRRIASLARAIAWLDTSRNQLTAIPAWLLLVPVQAACAIERWRSRSGAAIGAWLDALGEMEALLALASHRHENPEDVDPEVVPGPALFTATALGHPLIPRDRVVRNDVAIGDGVRALVVSGSNMSGKSTLLRTVGVAAVMAHAGLPVRAASLRLSPLQPGATLHVQDSLQAGTSRFYAEITRLKQLVDIAAGPVPLLFLLDELLAGTNSHDRRAGAAGVIRGLVDRGAIGLVTTHDLALAELGGGALANVHFEDQLVDGQLSFDYRMRPGVVARSNAIALMQAVGLDVKD
jgi:DNA mismatch repair ATPase MutS